MKTCAYCGAKMSARFSYWHQGKWYCYWCLAIKRMGERESSVRRSN